MASHRTHKWLRRIGYTCAAFIAVLFLLAGGLFYEMWFGNRTRAGALPAALLFQSAQRTHAHDVLANLPPLDSLGADGLRFAVIRWASPSWYGLSLGGSGPVIQGTFIAIKPYELRVIARKSFTMPRSEYTRLSERIDSLAQGYRGEEEDCYDMGTIGFEHARASGIISGAGIFGCTKHYTALAETIFAVIRTVGLPDGSDAIIGLGGVSAHK